MSSSASFADWFPQAIIGTTFTALGVTKLVGLKLGMVGGAGKPWKQRLCGT